MDMNEVDEAVVTCAQIEHNPENNVPPYLLGL
jgi:hypothetical protein